ncbi:hypothetical protein PJK45_24590 [Mycobacterium kansasii]|uniref:hypothetical protein n=1 Tax=Mycobacterium kansasii TaxID=1768 RepID=UPI0012BC3807|nr:hypothetical protein [Mycobacterium kansasii]UCA20431.1 hypothetical protein LA359_03215 [Mycobacterium kansasii]UGT80485.1 hypothetical protein LTS70_23610 [Mycobacterium kansasii]UGT84763.1 hypothetical protein LTT71_16995 [Mycobacterium kansasii]UGU27001.1 hypothetical protein LT351_10510 [Mycobacterium kansasii]
MSRVRVPSLTPQVSGILATLAQRLTGTGTTMAAVDAGGFRAPTRYIRVAAK